MPDITGAEVRARVDAGSCVLGPGELVRAAEVTTKELSQCHFQTGSGFVFNYFDADEPEPAQAAPVPRPKVKHMSTPVTPPPAPVSLHEPVQSPVEAVVAQVPALPAQVADLKSAIPADASGMGVLMAVVAVAGGGAAWKFYDSHSKRKHEEAMARIEKQDNQPGECKAHAAMNAQMSSVAAKVDAVAAKLDALEKHGEQQRLTMGDWNMDEFDERLAKLEKAAKQKKADGKKR